MSLPLYMSSMLALKDSPGGHSLIYHTGSNNEDHYKLVQACSGYKGVSATSNIPSFMHFHETASEHV